MAAAAIGAYAYFTSNGSGTGSATVGTSQALTITQVGPRVNRAARALRARGAGDGVLGT
jgi:hypothetical protein